ncbi:hypothetical protein M3Y94_00580000 [Aphelenchoides besseyi]|nr:hypothetical protein M3Y94_00580000 [Aphelenchoides besseyi]KAI6222018.1 hypothetical protein M3Y95_00940100 [Aphelenchoides besseyi]
MLEGIYGYFFGAEASTNVKPNGEESNEWIFIDHKSGRSSPVLIDEPEIQTLEDEHLSSGPRQLTKTEQKRLRKMRLNVAATEKKRHIRERQLVQQQLMADTDNSSASSSATASPNSTPPSPQKHLEKSTISKAPPIQRGKAKQRSKTGSRQCSGRSNDRKCNNIN